MDKDADGRLTEDEVREVNAELFFLQKEIIFVFFYFTVNSVLALFCFTDYKS